MNYRQFACAVLLSGSALLPFSAQAQRPIPLQNLPAAATKANTQGIEVEIVEVGRLGALPEAITRPAGKFTLLVVNHSGNAQESFVLEPAAVGEGTIGANPFIRLRDRPSPSFRHRLAGLIDLPQGNFDLKSATSGKVLCKFQIN